MARICYLWELGADLGHMSSFLPVALELRARGHEVIAVVRELPRAEKIFGRNGFALLQAPLWQGTLLGAPKQTVSYAEILFRFGYLDASALTPMLRAWRELIALLKPQLIIADHAPTALIAARSLNVTRVTYGTGFTLPPREAPLPSMRPWSDVPKQRLIDSEQMVLATINKSLECFDSEPLTALSEVHSCAENFVISYPELDHYAERVNANYYGAIQSAGGSEPDWTADGANKIFAYIKRRYVDFEQLMEALAAAQCDVVAYIGGLTSEEFAKYQTPRLRISTQPYSMQSAAVRCDIAICHAGHGTTSTMLKAGKPLLLVPTQLEQSLLSRRVAQGGAGLTIDADTKNKKFDDALQRLLHEPEFRKNARTFANKYVEFTQRKIISSIADRSEEILDAGALSVANVRIRNFSSQRDTAHTE